MPPVQHALATAGVLTAALRRGGFMTGYSEELLASGITNAAAARSEPVRAAAERVVAAVQKIAAAGAANDSLAGKSTLKS